MNTNTPFTAAVVQTSPVFLNPQATIAKAVGLMEEAARHGAQLMAFPEVFIAGYPYWNWVLNPVQGSAWFEKLYHASLHLSDPLLQPLFEAARRWQMTVVMGMNEKGDTPGTLYNTNLIISHEGKLLGRHRKLVPTWAEKLTWSGGDGSSLKVYPTAVGALGTLACGENTNPLARFSLLAQGEQLHVANYIALPVAPPDYNMAEAIKIRAAAHSFEGKVFTLVSCTTLSKEIADALAPEAPGIHELFDRQQAAYSGIIGPNGAPVTEGLIDAEGIVYADIDLNRCIQPKQMHDILGHYNRFDVFELRINRKPLQPLYEGDASGWESLSGGVL